MFLASRFKEGGIGFCGILKAEVQSKAEPKERKFGYAKDFFKMAPDFDEPLEDFKNWM